MNFYENLEDAMKNLTTRGAFLTVKNNQGVNTMTISWGYIGFSWNKPYFVAMVRPQRYTYEMRRDMGSYCPLQYGGERRPEGRCITAGRIGQHFSEKLQEIFLCSGPNRRLSGTKPGWGFKTRINLVDAAGFIPAASTYQFLLFTHFFLVCDDLFPGQPFRLFQLRKTKPYFFDFLNLFFLIMSPELVRISISIS